MKIGFAYTGQGSQKIGMGLDFLEEFSHLKEKVSRATELCGIDFLKLYTEGPEEELNYTPNTQPAIVLFETMVTDIIRDKGISPAVVMGHSLGEYSAVYAADIVDFDTIIKIVAKRGELMQKHAEANPGTMAAILGLKKEDVKEICEKASVRGVVSISNVNLPTQIVISGEKDAVAYASELAKEAGAKRVVPLKVSGPFHSSLMKGARDEFEKYIAVIEFRPAKVDFISNNAGQVLRSAAEIKELLLKQFVNGVDWVSCVKAAEESGIDLVIEIGPAAVLTPMIRKISDKIDAVSVTCVDNLKNLLQNFYL